jgi:hypothetical protein
MRPSHAITGIVENRGHVIGRVRKNATRVTGHIAVLYPSSLMRCHLRVGLQNAANFAPYAHMARVCVSRHRSPESELAKTEAVVWGSVEIEEAEIERCLDGVKCLRLGNGGVDACEWRTPEDEMLANTKRSSPEVQSVRHGAKRVAGLLFEA